MEKEALTLFNSSDEMYKLLFSNMLNGFALHKIILGKKGKPIDYEYIDVNPSFEKMIGQKRKNIIGKRVTQIIPGIEKESANWIGLYGNVALGGKSITFENFSSDLNKWFSVSAYSPKKGYFITIVEDITERKIAETKLILSSQLLQKVIDLLPIRVFWKDTNLKYLGCNLAFARDAGKKSPEELIGQDDFKMAWKEQAKLYRSDDMKVIKTGVSKIDFVEPQTTPTGNKIWLKTSKVPLTDSNGNIIGALGTYEDITEKKKSEDDLKKSKNELQERLIELEKFNKLTTDRELKMIELKEKIKALQKNI